MKLIGIKTSNCFLVSDNIEGNKYFHSQLDKLFFDGKRATETYKSDWFKLDKEPSVIEKQLPAKKNQS